MTSLSVEDVASETVAIIQAFIGELQTIFPKPKLSSQGRRTPRLSEPLWPHLNNLRDRAQTVYTKACAVSKDDTKINFFERNEDISHDDRQRVVYEIVFPLLTSLCVCYTLLDQRQEPPSTTARPKAPSGLLSLQQYTDIACLLEYTVCASIVPSLSCVCPLSERIPQLPKSLLGRLSLPSLVWKPCETCYKTELHHSWMVLSTLLLLDRFRPMLLPRHLADLYSVYFYLQSSDSCELPPEDDPFAHLDAVLLASTFQKLLRRGASTPQWLKVSVSHRLQHLAQTHLKSVVTVFVRPSNVESDAARLARALSVEHSHCLSAALTVDATLAVIHTVWAVLQAHPHLIHRVLLGKDGWRVDNKPELLQELHGIIRRLAVLLSIVPKHKVVKDVCLLFVKRDTIVPRANLLQILLQLAVSNTIENGLIKEDTLWLIRLFVAAMLTISFDSVEAADVLAVALVDALGGNIQVREMDGAVAIDTVAPTTMDDTVSSVTQRSKLLFGNVLAHGQDGTSESSKASEAYTKELLSSCFKLIMVRYCSNLIGGNSSRDDLVPMVCLPLLCEAAAPETLVSSGEGVLEIIAIVLEFAQNRFASDTNDQNSTSRVKLGSMTDRYVIASELVQAQGHDTPKFQRIGYDGENDEMLLSLCSILLSLLVAILELGSDKRARDDEERLQSLSVSLGTLAGLSSQDRTGEQAQIAEMSSHALALIVSRNTQEIPSLDHAESKIDEMDQARKDLLSKEPPIRARGMVQLRRLALVLGEMRSTGMGKSENDRERELKEMLELSVAALGDAESYVYLAAIHTIVAIANADPVTVIPLLGRAVLTGLLYSTFPEPIQISMEQRAKLTESLVFVVRRRVSVDQELSGLVEILVSGPQQIEKSTVTSAETIQELTHRYFVETKEEYYNDEQYWEEMKLRVNTGGPLFASEETDVVRASCIHLMSELVGVLSPSLVAPYCATLIGCCLSALRFGMSRPIRRAGATLSRELYAALLRELGDSSDETSSHLQPSVPLAMAMVKHHHETLKATLHRCVCEEDGVILDPATIARCEEAIECQQQAESTGALALGAIAWERARLEAENPIARLLQTELQPKARKLQSLFKIEEL